MKRRVMIDLSVDQAWAAMEVLDVFLEKHPTDREVAGVLKQFEKVLTVKKTSGGTETLWISND